MSDKNPIKLLTSEQKATLSAKIKQQAADKAAADKLKKQGANKITNPEIINNPQPIIEIKENKETPLQTEKSMSDTNQATTNPADEPAKTNATEVKPLELSEEIPHDDINPVRGDTVDRPYATRPLDGTNAEVIYEVEPISFNPPPPPPPTNGSGGINPPPIPPNSGGSTGPNPSVGPEGPFNQPFSEVDDKDKKLGAAMLVDGILDGYEKLHDLGNHFVQMPENELIKLANEGKLDLSLRIPTGPNESITISEFVQNFNTEASSAFNVDPNFRKDIREPMIRIFIKRNWGVTDEQYVLGKFAMDVGQKAMIFFSLKSQIKDAVKAFSDTYVANKNTGQNIPVTPAGGQANASSENSAYTKNADGTMTDNNVHIPVVVVDGE